MHAHGGADIQTRLAALEAPVRLVLFSQTFGCDTCLEARQVVDQIASLSEQVTVEEHNLVLDREVVEAYGVARAPALAIVGAEDIGLRFVGVPSGFEVESIVTAIELAAAGKPPRLGEDTQAAIDALDRDVEIQVFVTPTCRFCPQAVSLAYRLAAASPRVTATAIEATEFPDLAQKYRVTGVPKTVVNERIEIMGAVPESEFAAQALSSWE